MFSIIRPRVINGKYLPALRNENCISQLLVGGILKAFYLSIKVGKSKNINTASDRL